MSELDALGERACELALQEWHKAEMHRQASEELFCRIVRNRKRSYDTDDGGAWRDAYRERGSPIDQP